MSIQITPSNLREIKWHEYLVRFILGGVATAGAGLIAKEFGPVVGGLFLAFPAIFPASASLIQKHELERKQRKGLRGEKRARQAAALDAAGAALGSIALLVFAALVWRLLPGHRGLVTISLASVAWVVVAVALWSIMKRL